MNNIKCNEETFIIKPQKKYIVDFDKVNNFDDLKNIVQILFAGLPITITDDCHFIDEIRKYLVEIK